jgi:hypothetical protein
MPSNALKQATKGLEPHAKRILHHDDALYYLRLMLNGGEIPLGSEADAYLHDPFFGDRFDVVRENLRRRFDTICGDLSGEEFNLLIEKMARQQVRSELRPPI